MDGGADLCQNTYTWGQRSSAWTQDLAGVISSPWHGRLPAATVLGLMPLFLSEDVLAYKNHVFLGVGQSQQKGGEVSRLSVPPPPSRGCPVPPGGWQEGSGGLLQTHGPGPQSGLLQPLHSSGIGFNCPAFNKVVLSLQVYDSYSPCLSTSCKSLESPSDL